MLKIRFRALLTQCGDPVENGELIIDDGEIVETGTHEQLMSQGQVYANMVRRQHEAVSLI